MNENNQHADAKHTPGPWMYEERCAGIVIKDGQQEETIIAMIIPNDDDDECTDLQEANAELIARAPGLAAEVAELRKENERLKIESSKFAFEADRAKYDRNKAELETEQLRSERDKMREALEGIIALELDQYQWKHDCVAIAKSALSGGSKQ